MRGGGRSGLLTVRCTRGRGDRGRGDVLDCQRQLVPDVYVRDFRAGEREGRGTVQIANGGPAAGWEVVCVILLDEVDRIAQALGQSVVGARCSGGDPVIADLIGVHSSM